MKKKNENVMYNKKKKKKKKLIKPLRFQYSSWKSIFRL